jgi:hypothetical protein
MAYYPQREPKRHMRRNRESKKCNDLELPLNLPNHPLVNLRVLKSSSSHQRMETLKPRGKSAMTVTMTTLF